MWERKKAGPSAGAQAERIETNRASDAEEPATSANSPGPAAAAAAAGFPPAHPRRPALSAESTFSTAHSWPTAASRWSGASVKEVWILKSLFENNKCEIVPNQDHHPAPRS